MDDVFVPWEDVFVYADVEKANNFFRVPAFSRARSSTGVPASP